MKRIILLIASAALLISTAFAYTDVDDAYEFKEAVNYITEQGIAEGYEDGSFRAYNPIKRAEFTKILVEAKLGHEPVEYADGINGERCFSDVPNGKWFTSYVCWAKDNGIVHGNDTNGLFDPSEFINFAAASKIMVNALEVQRVNPNGDKWYHEYVEPLAELKYVPTTVQSVSTEITRGDMAEMIWRIKTDNQSQEYVSRDHFTSPKCMPFAPQQLNGVDMDTVRDTWMGWYNGVRADAGLHAYTWNNQLDRSAYTWAKFASDRGYMDHKRPGATEYYDYNMITEWFADLGLVFENVYRVTHTENISSSSFSCSSGDCTQKMINALRPTFDHYMNEVNDDYRPHYNSVMNGYFNEIGLGIYVNPANSRMYITIHYGTKIISDPLPICES